MSRNLPDFDPYIVLGVDKKSSSSEIKTAYRKLVLKCHPDKIQDESLRSKAVDDFQKVQESYEILSDDTRRQLYNQEVYLETLRNELKASKSSADTHSSSMGTSSREFFRDGRMYEERVPADAKFFTDSDEPRYTEEPTTYSSKYNDNAKRPHTKVTEEKKKAKASPHTASSPRFTKQSDREYTRAAHHDRDKVRTKERRRDASDKHERTTAAYVVSDTDDFSASDAEHVYYTTKSDRYSHRDSVPRRSKANTVPAYAYSDSEGDSEDDYVTQKLDSQMSHLKEYISRNKDPVIQVDRRPRSSRHPTYDDRDRDRHHSERSGRESTRYSTRSSYSKTEGTRVTESSSTHTSRRSHERLSPPIQGYDRERERERTAPSMPSKSSSQRSSSTWAPPPVARAATMPHPPRSRREGLTRSESNMLPTLVNMVTGLKGDTAVHSRARPRAADRNDSGYSSGPGTPEIPQGSGSTTSKINRFKVVETPDMERETIVVEPRYHKSPPSPSRADRERERERSSTSSRTVKPTRTYSYEPETRPEIRPEIRTVRPASVSSKSTPTTRPLYREIRHSPDIIFEGKRYRQTVH